GIPPHRAGHMLNLLRELRLTIRSLLRVPGFTAAAVGTLGLGIGANVAAYSVADAVLLRPLPFREPERIVQVRYAGAASVSGERFYRLERDVRSYEAFGAYT